MATKVVTNLNLSRYELFVDGELVGFTEFEMEGAAAVFPHTEVDPRLAGQGLGEQLVREALDDMRAQGVKVVPQCEFVAAFVEKHSAYHDLVA